MATVPAIDPQAHLHEVERWRSDRLARLAGPEGWLSVVGLEWLHGGAHAVGSDPAGDAVLPASAPGRVGTLTIAGDERVTFAPEDGVEVRTLHRPLRGPIDLRDDHPGPPTKLRVGSIVFYVIRRAEGLALRIKDADAPARRAFDGIDHYPVDARWRVDARLEPFDPPRVALVPTVLGGTETYAVPGALAFEVEGVTHRLEAYLEDGTTDLFVVFADATNRDETFGGGRFLYTPPPDEAGLVPLDFNRAYNPPCVFTPHATCPLPTAENRLPIRIEAGEKRYGSKGS